MAASIFWASNGEFKIRFVDALFVCVSAATGTGLSPVDLSSTTPWQQAIITLLEICGNLVFVSWVVVYFRRSVPSPSIECKWLTFLSAYFIDHLKHIVAAEHERKIARHETSASHASRAIVDNLVAHGLAELHERQSSTTQRRTSKWTSGEGPPVICADMVRRLDIAPHPIDPTGNTSLASGVQPMCSPRAVDSDRSPRAKSIDASAQPRHAHPESFGGFPYPWHVLSRMLRRLFPTLHEKLRRTMTMPRTSTLLPPNGDPAAVLTGETTRRVPYISFSAHVGRNSTFHDLTDENIEELGGVEYRALTALLWIVPLVGIYAVFERIVDKHLPAVLLRIIGNDLHHHRPVRESSAVAVDLPRPRATP